MILQRFLIFLLFVFLYNLSFAQNENSELKQLNVHELNRINEHTGIKPLEEMYYSDEDLLLSNRSEGELIFLAYLFLKESKKEIAKNIFKYTIDLYPNSSKANYYLSKIFLEEGNYSEAVEKLKNSSLHADDPSYHNLPWLYSNKYEPLELPEDDMDLFVSNNNWESDTVLVYVQGGPDFKLRLSEKDPLNLMTNSRNILKIWPYQSTILNPSIINAVPAISKEQAELENKKSSVILSRTLNYLKEKEKKTFVICFSHGTTICAEYLANEEEIPAEKIFLLGNQLNNIHEQEAISSLKPGEITRWKNGKEPISVDFFSLIPKDFPFKKDYDHIANNLQNLGYVSYKNDYCQLINPVHFDKIIMIYADKDEATGPVHLAEKQFLDSIGASYFELNSTHTQLMQKENLKAIWKHIQTNEPLNFSDSGFILIYPDAYEIAKDAILTNQKIKSEVGEIESFGDIPLVSSRASFDFVSAIFRIKVIGEKKTIEVVVYLTKDPGKEWELVEVKR